MRDLHLKQNFGGEKDMESYVFRWQEKVYSDVSVRFHLNQVNAKVKSFSDGFLGKFIVLLILRGSKKVKREVRNISLSRSFSVNALVFESVGG